MQNCYTALGIPERIWAVSAIHGDLEKLISIHDQILENFDPGQKIIYLGNYTGFGIESAACVDEILAFRRLVLSLRGVLPEDFVYLRGNQEEIIHKLFQLPFAPNPLNVYLWMLDNGLSQTLKSYDIEPQDGIEACNRGAVVLTKWIAKVKYKMRCRPGHEIFSTQWVRAAFTDICGQYPMLFVHAGLETNKPLPEQGDRLWWGSDDFERMEHPYLPFQKVVRGYDPAHKGVHLNCITATLDGGCGFGGTLVCTGFLPDGQIAGVFESA